MTLPNAEDLPYWKSGQSPAESWLDKTEKLLVDAGGTVQLRMVGRQGEIEGIIFGFVLAGDSYKLSWPVLPTRKEADRPAARRQAATMIYHDTKARVARLRIFGPRVVFADWLVLGDGSTVAERGGQGVPELLEGVKLLP